jgi:perosamine synthetase
MGFVVSRDPRLNLSVLFRGFRQSPLPLPCGGVRTYHFFQARNAIYHGLRALGISSKDTILVPSFHCLSAIDPILAYGAKIKFYNVHHDASIDIDDLQSKIDQTTKGVLVIHYFGFPQNIRLLKSLCDSQKIFLIEDCAHVLTSKIDGKELGTFGDVSIFSWRKFLPLYDGGQLVINNTRLQISIPWKKNSLLYSMKVTKNILDKLLEDSQPKSAQAITSIMKASYRLVGRLLSSDGQEGDVVTIKAYGQKFEISFVNVPMSGLSKYILRRLDILDIVEKRRLNCQHVSKALEAITGIVPFFPKPPTDWCPWVFPVLTSKKNDFHLPLRSKGIQAFTWGGVIHPLLPINKFPAAAFLYENLVLLPIHQSLTGLEMQFMMQTIKDIINE